MKELVPFPTARPGESAGGAGAGDFSADATRLEDHDEAGQGELSVWRATLVVSTGSANTNVVPLGVEPVRIGRAAGNQLTLADDRVSRVHAEVRYENGHYVIEDLNSSNGVRVNDQRVERAVLANGDRIALGVTVLELKLGLPEVPEKARLQLLESSDLLQSLAPATKATLAAGMTPRFYPRRAVIVQQGSPLERMILVYRGRLRVVTLNDEGGERLVARLGTREGYGERALVDGSPSAHTVIADIDACVLELPKRLLTEVLQKRPEESQSVVRTIRKKLQTAQVRTADVRASLDDLDNIVTATDVEIVGEDGKIVRAKQRIEALAKESGPVLIIGPSGVGKHTFARHFHRSGPRASQAYVEVSVADLAQGGITKAVFGVEGQGDASHMKGEVGYLEMMGEGTLTIAHAELLDVHQQSLLATYLSLGWFHRVFGRETVTSKTKVVFLATGANEAEVTANLIPELRELLSKSTISLPPLTQRLKDIPLLGEHYLKYYASKGGRRAEGLSREAIDKLVSYGWPGNITELENVMQRAAIVSTVATIIPGDLIFVAPPEKEVHKLNILRNERVRAILRNPMLLSSLMTTCLIAVGAVMLVTLAGSLLPAGHALSNDNTNPGMLITWVVWFPLVPISAFFLGRIWCGMCPIIGFAELVGKLKRYHLPVPKRIQHLGFWGVAGAFLVVDVLEGELGIASSPWGTLVFLVIILYAAAAMTVLFERRAFCRHLCPLAGVLSTYATMSPIEVRGNTRVCQSQCGEHTCFKGTDKVEGCPMGSYPAAITSNIDCMMCGKCLRSCDNRGVQVNVRPPLQELWRNPKPELALSIFSVLLVGVMAFRQFPKLTFWRALEARLALGGLWYDLALFAGFTIVAALAFVISSTLSAATSQQKLKENMALFGVAFIPLAFSGHLSYLADKILNKGLYKVVTYIVLVFQSVFKSVPIAGNAYSVAPFINPAVVTFLKLLLVFGGAAGSLVAIVMISRRLGQQAAFARALPHLLLLGAFWIFYLVTFTGSIAKPVTATPPTGAAAVVTDVLPQAPVATTIPSG